MQERGRETNGGRRESRVSCGQPETPPSRFLRRVPRQGERGRATTSTLAERRGVAVNMAVGNLCDGVVDHSDTLRASEVEGLGKAEWMHRDVLQSKPSRIPSGANA